LGVSRNTTVARTPLAVRFLREDPHNTFLPLIFGLDFIHQFQLPSTMQSRLTPVSTVRSPTFTKGPQLPGWATHKKVSHNRRIDQVQIFSLRERPAPCRGFPASCFRVRACLLPEGTIESLPDGRGPRGNYTWAAGFFLRRIRRSPLEYLQTPQGLCSLHEAQQTVRFCPISGVCNKRRAFHSAFRVLFFPFHMPVLRVR